MNLVDAIRQSINDASPVQALPAAPYYIERSNIVHLDELQEFQDHVFTTLNPKLKHFVLPKPKTYRAKAWAEGGALFTTRFEHNGEIAGSLVGVALRDRSTYECALNMNLLAGRDCWFNKSTLYLSSGLVDRKYNHYGVMEQMLLAAHNKTGNGIDSLCFLVTCDNLPMIKAALSVGFYIIGLAYNNDIERTVFLFEYENKQEFVRQDEVLHTKMLHLSGSSTELETMLDDDYVITGIDMSSRSYQLQKCMQITKRQEQAA